MRFHSGRREDILLALCEAFVEEVPSLVRRIEQAVTQQDASGLRTAAHTLKSCLAYVADEQDVRRAAEIEAKAPRPHAVTSDQVDEIRAIAQRWVECVRLLRDETNSA